MKREFSNWLKSNKGFSSAAAYDVASRLRRVISICDLDWQADLDSNLFTLGRKEEFKELTVSVRSQLRRSVKLYREFLFSGSDLDTANNA
jgi:DNA (cytosine-5)-methyltransferase 1